MLSAIKPSEVSAIKMASYKSGQREPYFWIEFPPNTLDLHNLVKKQPEIFLNNYLAIVCFDSGPFRLVEEERSTGWYEKDGVAYSPKLSQQLINVVCSEQYDQWCLFNSPTEFTHMTPFVNYGGFKISNRRQEIEDADPTWDKVGLAKQIEYHEHLVELFWKELQALNPLHFIADGDNFIFVTKDHFTIRNLVELVRAENY